MDFLTNLIDYNSLVIGGIGFLSGILISFAKAIFNYIMGKTSNGLIKKAIEKAEDITLGIIESVYNELVKQAKIDLKDNVITKEEYQGLLKLAKETALNRLTKLIGDPLKKVMGSTIEEIKEFLSNLIEKKIDEVKK